ncbi:MAG: pitrilysin family protein, partial [Candidatus Competibacteraceae bacterium]|nr:pitrilysin family protein [Candidatus Competibacteraceae bacterium]
LGGGAAKDMAYLSLRSLVDPNYLDPAVDVVSRLLREPAFSTADLERERARMLTGVAARRQSPGELAQVAFNETLYGDHPYATPPDGYEASLKTITGRDVRAFHQRYYVGSNLVIAIVGDLDRSAAARLAEALTGGLPTGEAAPALPEVKRLGEGQTVHISHPSSQSHVLMGQVGIQRGNPHYYALYLGNHVLGGSGLVSLLAEEVREKRGLSYSVYSYFAPMAAQGPFVMGLQTRTDQTGEAIEVLQETLAGFVAQGPEAQALEAARQNITGGFPLRLDSNAKIVQYLAAIGFYDLPLDYLEVFPQRIESLTRAQVTEALQSHLRPEQLLTVIVGGDGS